MYFRQIQQSCQTSGSEVIRRLSYAVPNKLAGKPALLNYVTALHGFDHENLCNLGFAT